ncbi:MAG: helix-turn-helix transcriptional regulator [Ruminiclostridium sp.]|jgi:transcriptional regulator with XRE-family HTH domain|nr:helix-turn-helix transcriptional regulator [Ruminiclostridium sp.]
MKLEEKLLRLRKQHGLSQQEMADELAVSRQTISKWETGITIPSSENLIGIGKLLNVPINVLVDDSASLEPPPVSSTATEPMKTEDQKIIGHVFRFSKKLCFAFCILLFLIGIFLGTRLPFSNRWTRDERQPDPMEELVKVEVDISHADSFSTEPLQP